MSARFLQSSIGQGVPTLFPIVHRKIIKSGRTAIILRPYSTKTPASGKVDYTREVLIVCKSYYLCRLRLFKIDVFDRETSPIEYAALPLDYDRKCASYNEFRGEGDFESGYSFAAELLPDSLIAGQITFRLDFF